MPSLKFLLCTTFTLLTLLPRVLGVCLYYLPRATRPNATWSWKTSVNLKLLLLWLRYAANVRWRTNKSLEPGREGDRFIVIDPPADASHTQNHIKSPYQGILLSNPAILPAPVGGVWYPACPPTDKPLRRLVLHFHPGAYVLQGARPGENGGGPRVFSEQSGWPVLAVQYRLSLDEDSRFPAALQDAITTYVYALDTLKIPASQIVLSGESAGGHLVFAMLRYLSTENQSLPLPRAALLLHPWVDFTEKAIAGFEHHHNFHSDFVFYDLIEWGAAAYTPHGWPRDHPYLNPLGNEFRLTVPIFIQTGTAEVLYDGHVQFAFTMKKQGNVVVLHEVPHAPHAIFDLGEVFDFREASLEGHRLAARFIERAGEEASNIDTLH